MAHPRAQPAEALVELDQWVRGGGHVLLLADPKLDWPSERPLGDLLRPPPMFADTGLLVHWGLKLSVRKPASAAMGMRQLAGVSTTLQDMIARCRIGQGIGDGHRRCRFHECRGAGAPPDLDLLMCRAGPARNSLNRRESRDFPTILSTGLPSKNRHGTNG